jgi:hypothetical protein
MTMQTHTLDLSPVLFNETRLAQFFKSADKGSRALTTSAGTFFIFFILCALMQVLDQRELNGANVWVKPGKFFFSMVVHFLTVAWALSLVDETQRNSRTINWAIVVMQVTAWSELLYIAYRASLADASHFNVATPLNAALYSVMAVFAIALVVAPAIIGYCIWRSNRTSLWTETVVLGFALAATLSIIVGMTLGGNSSHWIGGDLTDATGLPIFKWSTTGGDLRVAHFIGLHAMQVIPFAALSGKRSVVWGTALAVVAVTALTYFQALAGIPLLKA